MNEFIGRQKELKILKRIQTSGRAEFVAVYGRRRVGKTMLIRHFFKDEFSFQMTGIGNSTMKKQLGNFHQALGEFTDNSGTEK